MCASCFTALDAYAMQAGAALAAGSTGVRWLLSGARGDRGARKQQRWDETAAFLREMGHNADAVIGPRP